MDCHWSKLKRPLLVIATGAMVLAAAAQESGQDIIFSSPKSDGSQAVTPSLTPQNSQLQGLPNALLTPGPAFPARPSEGRLPPVNFAEPRGQKTSPEERRNWMLMTPAEIFGVPDVEKLLKPPERDAFGREKKTTQLERFLDRETQARAGLTNGWRSDQAGLPWSLSRDANNDDSPFARRRDGAVDTAQNVARFQDGQQGKNFPAGQKGKPDSIASENVFAAFDQQKATKQKLEQQVTMQRFRQMMLPGSEPAEPSPNSRYFPAPKPVVNPNMTQPDFVPNPAGASFKPLVSNIGRPAGLTPLPGVVTPRLQPAMIPSWKPQPPPWMSPSPAFSQQRF